MIGVTTQLLVPKHHRSQVHIHMGWGTRYFSRFRGLHYLSHGYHQPLCSLTLIITGTGVSPTILEAQQSVNRVICSLLSLTFSNPSAMAYSNAIADEYPFSALGKLVSYDRSLYLGSFIVGVFVWDRSLCSRFYGISYVTHI